MRLLILALNFPPELISSGRYTGEMAFFLADQGVDVCVVTAPPYYPHWKIRKGYSGTRYLTESLKNVQVIRCPLWVPQHPTKLNRLPHLLSFALSSFPVLLLQALRFKPDIIFCVVPTFFSAPFALLVGWLSRAKCWLHIQDFELDAAYNLGMLPKRKLLYLLALWFEKITLQHYDHVSTISENMLRLSIKKGVHPKQASLLINWVDTEKISPLSVPSSLRAELNISDQTFVALYHGNMGLKQGLDHLIETARLLQSNPRIIIVMCGEGPAKKKLIERAASFTNICFLELQPEERLNDLVNLADVHILPQLSNVADLVMPSKLSTMLASGKPVIAGAYPDTQISRVLDIIGILYTPESAVALAEALIDLYENPPKRINLGKLGRAFACEHLDKRIVLSRFYASLKSEIL